MSTVDPRPSPPASVPDRQLRATRPSAESRLVARQARQGGGRRLRPDEAALFEEMLGAWRAKRIGAQRHTVEAVEDGIATVRDFVDHAGTAPWNWTEDDFDRWCCHLGLERGLTPATQRKYQNAIKSFLGYVSTNTGICNRTMRDFGVRPMQIVNEENSIPHVLDRETVTARRRLSQDELSRLFGALDDAIAEAGRFRGKDLLPLMRDKAMFFTIYTLGLRSAEVRGLDAGSFHPRTGFTEFGRFGQAIVFGKGSRGSGPKARTVQVQNPALPPMLEWYCGRVRPKFLTFADFNEQALFLSERGRRLSRTALATRLTLALDRAGLAGMGFSPHALRRSSASDLARGMSGQAVQHFLGHAHMSTTAGYVEFDDEFIQGQADAHVRRQIEAATRRKEDE